MNPCTIVRAMVMAALPYSSRCAWRRLSDSDCTCTDGMSDSDDDLYYRDDEFHRFGKSSLTVATSSAARGRGKRAMSCPLVDIPRTLKRDLPPLQGTED